MSSRPEKSCLHDFEAPGSIFLLPVLIGWVPGLRALASQMHAARDDKLCRSPNFKLALVIGWPQHGVLVGFQLAVSHGQNFEIFGGCLFDQGFDLFPDL